MLVLGLAYGLIEAGLIDQTLFKPPELTTGVVGAATYVPALGISVSDLPSFVVGHAGWSIGVPRRHGRGPRPTRRTTPWLGRAGGPHHTPLHPVAVYAPGSTRPRYRRISMSRTQA
jgi:hypothetical protein